LPLVALHKATQGNDGGAEVIKNLLYKRTR